MESLSNDKWRWKLRLFVSADLVGSTAYKAASSDDVPDWSSTFAEFFRDFPSIVSAQYANLPQIDSRFPACPKLLRPWKFLGDEILFAAELTQHTEIPSHLYSMKCAFRDFLNLWSKKDKPIPLRLKGAAWIAGFPVTNSEIEISTDGSKSVDFIGPSMDLGFRIAKFSDERRFILSADLAFMLVHALTRTELERNSKLIKLFLHGREPLRGVIDSRPYPIVWMDMEEEHLDREDELIGSSRLHDHSKLQVYLGVFIDKIPKLSRPFIAGDRDEKFSTIPPKFDSLRERKKKEETGRDFRSQSPEEEQELTGIPTTLKDPDPPPNDIPK